LAITASSLASSFRAHFSNTNPPVLYRAPGRVNMMGEHTDYNQGLVCPMALEMACYAAVAPANHGKLRVYSESMRESREWPINELASRPPQRDWGDYIAGVAIELYGAGISLSGCDLYLESDVPGGAGLSSSASVEVATALALLGPRDMDKLEMAKLCQRAESEYVGMPCGIMDQYASVFGQRDSAIQIDCRTLESEAVHLPRELLVVVVNSRVKHELGTSAYRQRVAECQQAISAIQKFNPGVRSLRDVTPESLEKIQDRLPEISRKRARHVAFDNARVLQFAAAARENDLREMGRLFLMSHRSAQYDYEISCEELDFLVDSATGIDGVYGARMTGGGFGGCTVNLLAPDAASVFQERMTEVYRKRFSIEPLFYNCLPAEGAGRL
jgi:galactokinase